MLAVPFVIGKNTSCFPKSGPPICECYILSTIIAAPNTERGHSVQLLYPAADPISSLYVLMDSIRRSSLLSL